MMMKASPRTAFEMIQPQIILGALKVLLDVPAGATQFQAAGFGGRSMEMGQVIVIGFGVPRRPVPHQPDFFQFAPRLPQVVWQENLAPSQPRAPGLPARRYPRALLPLLLRDSRGQLRQGGGGRFSLTDMPPDPLYFRPHLVIPSLERVPIDLQEKLHAQVAHPGAKFRVVAVGAIPRDRCRRDAVTPRLAKYLQRQLRLGGKLHFLRDSRGQAAFPVPRP